MLLSSVIIVLREVLEASIVIATFLALSEVKGRHCVVMVNAFVVGFVGAITFALCTRTVSEWFDYTGLELIESVFQCITYLGIVAFILIQAMEQRAGQVREKLQHGAIVLVVSLLMTREGSEILLFISGFFTRPNGVLAASVGGVIGAGIGISIGAIIYYLLIALQELRFLVGGTVLSLVGAGLLLQTVSRLYQAGYLDQPKPLWDSSEILSEHSLVGQLLYAVMGYEASPTPLQATVFISSLLLMAGLVFVLNARINGRSVRE